jgi:hypothetical protein
MSGFRGFTAKSADSRICGKTPTGNKVLKKILGVIVGIGAMVIGLMFFMVAFSVIVVVALLVWAYFWWKTRKLRSAMRAQQAASPASGNVFEGEAVVVREYTVDTTNLLPGDARKDPSAPHHP